MSAERFLNSWVGDYQLVEFLGAGGMGDVYRGVHGQTRQVVAVKVLSDAQVRSGVARVLNEARILASLRHKNIAAFYELLDMGGRPCIVMEYVDGVTVTERLRLSGSLPVPVALAAFRAVVDAVHYMHSEGVVHRDLKSSNIKVTTGGEVKVLDFGIARSSSTPRMTRTGNVIGTLENLSPEQIRSGEADHRSDIWALGVLLYEMTTGQLPFQQQAIGDLYESIIRSDYTPPSVLNPSVFQDVERIIQRCLRKRPGDRFQSASRLLDHVEAVTKETSPLARSISRYWHTALGTGHNWLLWAATALVVVLLLVMFRFAWTSPGAEQPQDVPAATAPAGPGIRYPPPSRAPLVSPGVAVIPAPAEVPRAPTAPVTPAAPAPAGPSAEIERPALRLGEKTVEIDVSGGSAQVYMSGQFIGNTPLRIRGQFGQKIDVTLKQTGYKDVPVSFEISERKVYTYAMEPE